MRLQSNLVRSILAFLATGLGMASAAADETLRVSSGNDVPVAVSEAALNELTRLAVAGDKLGIAVLVANGSVFVVSNGTKILAIDKGLLRSEVRILEGPRRGSKGWVPSEFIVEPKPETAEERAKRETTQKKAMEQAEKAKKARDAKTISDKLKSAQELFGKGKKAHGDADYPVANWCLKKAVAECESVVKLDPPNKEADQAKKTMAEAKKLLEAGKAEQDAARKLKLAKMLAADGLKDKARVRLKEVAEKYPDTAAGKEAKELLSKLNG